MKSKKVNYKGGLYLHLDKNRNIIGEFPVGDFSIVYPNVVKMEYSKEADAKYTFYFGFEITFEDGVYKLGYTFGKEFKVFHYDTYKDLLSRVNGIYNSLKFTATKGKFTKRQYIEEYQDRWYPPNVVPLFITNEPLQTARCIICREYEGGTKMEICLYSHKEGRFVYNDGVGVKNVIGWMKAPKMIEL